ncbi:MAG: non-canonical purine NTP pyrophosphatase [Nitrospirota bacterium]
MQELLIATKNPGKFGEISEVFRGLPFELLFLGNMDVDDRDFVEDGFTFAENARKKAKYFSDKVGMLVLAEDSGILVDALEGELGVRTRRWGAGETASDEEWIEHFMKRMEGEGNRGARFKCSACLIDGDDEKIFDGETCGLITEKLMAPLIAGLPLSSCFLPEGCEKVYAALSEDEKNLVSHRGKAIRAVRSFFETD